MLAVLTQLEAVLATLRDKRTDEGGFEKNGMVGAHEWYMKCNTS